jgi:vacuolar-type H+-ATPase subunit C/Vma6
MNFEYYSIRLAARRSRFLPDSELVTIMEGGDPLSVVNILENYIFAPETLALRSQPDALTPERLLALIDAGYARIMEDLFLMVHPLDPALTELLFARFELEQIKAACRSFAAGLRRFTDTTPPFINLRGSRGWTQQFLAAPDRKTFTDGFAAIGHPFAKPLATATGADKWVKAEQALERYYFTEFLQLRQEIIGDAKGYFADQHNCVLLPLAATLRLGNVSDSTAEELYIPGPGAITCRRFVTLATATDLDSLARNVYRWTGAKVTHNQLLYPAKLAVTVRRHVIARYRRMVRQIPPSLFDLFLYVEEVKAMVANISVALRSGWANAPLDSTTPWLITTGRG